MTRSLRWMGWKDVVCILALLGVQFCEGAGGCALAQTADARLYVVIDTANEFLGAFSLSQQQSARLDQKIKVLEGRMATPGAAAGSDIDGLELGIALVAARRNESARLYLQRNIPPVGSPPAAKAFGLRIGLARFLSYADAGELEMARHEEIDISAYGASWEALPQTLQWRYLFADLQVRSAPSDQAGRDQLRIAVDRSLLLLPGLIGQGSDPGDEAFHSIIDLTSLLDRSDIVRIMDRLLQANGPRRKDDRWLIVNAHACSILLMAATGAGQVGDLSDRATYCQQSIDPRALTAAQVRLIFRDASDVPPVLDTDLVKLSFYAPFYLLQRGRLKHQERQFVEALALFRQASAVVYANSPLASVLWSQISLESGSTSSWLNDMVAEERYFAAADKFAGNPDQRLYALQMLQEAAVAADDNRLLVQVLRQQHDDLIRIKRVDAPADTWRLLQIGWAQVRLGDHAAALASMGAADEQMARLPVNEPGRAELRYALDVARKVASSRSQKGASTDRPVGVPETLNPVTSLWSQRLKLLTAMDAGAHDVVAVLDKWPAQASPLERYASIGSEGLWIVEQLRQDGRRQEAMEVARWLLDLASSTEFGTLAVATRLKRELAEAAAADGDAAGALKIADQALIQLGGSPLPETFVDFALIKYRSLLSLGRVAEAKPLPGQMELALRQFSSTSRERREAVRALNPDANNGVTAPDYSDMIKVIASDDTGLEVIPKIDPLPRDVHELIDDLAKKPAKSAQRHLAGLAEQLARAKRPDAAVLSRTRQLEILEKSGEPAEESRLSILMEIGSLGLAEGIVQREPSKRSFAEAVRLTEGHADDKASRIEALKGLAELAHLENALGDAARYFAQAMSMPEWHWNITPADALDLIRKAAQTATKAKSVEDLDIIFGALCELAVSIDKDDRNDTLAAIDRIDEHYEKLGLPYDRIRVLSLRLYVNSKDDSQDLRELQSTLRAIMDAGTAGQWKDLYSAGAWFSDIDGRILAGTLSNAANEPVRQLVSKYVELQRRLSKTPRESGIGLDGPLASLQSVLDQKRRELSAGQLGQAIASAIALNKFYFARGSSEQATRTLDFALSLLRDESLPLTAQRREADFADIAVELIKHDGQLPAAKQVWSESLTSITRKNAKPAQVRRNLVGVRRKLDMLRDAARAADRGSAYLELADLSVDALKKAYPGAPSLAILEGSLVGDLLALQRRSQAVHAVRTLWEALAAPDFDKDKDEEEVLEALGRASRAFQADFFLSVLNFGEKADATPLKEVLSTFEEQPGSRRPYSEIGQQYVLLAGQAACSADPTGADRLLSKGIAAFEAWAQGPLPYLLQLDIAWFRVNALELQGNRGAAISLLNSQSTDIAERLRMNSMTATENDELRYWLRKAQAHLAALYIANKNYADAERGLAVVLDEQSGNPARQLQQILQIASALVAAGQIERAEPLVERVLAERQMLEVQAPPALKDAYALKAFLALNKKHYAEVLRLLRDRQRVDAVAGEKVFAAARLSATTRQLYSFGTGEVVLSQSSAGRGNEPARAETEQGVAALEIAALAGISAELTDDASRDAVADAMQRVSASQTAETLYLSAVRQGIGSSDLATALKTYMRLLAEQQDGLDQMRGQNLERLSLAASSAIPSFVGQDFSLIPPCVDEVKQARRTAQLALGASRLTDGPRIDGLRFGSSTDFATVTETIRTRWPSAYEALNSRFLTFRESAALLREDEALIQFVTFGQRVLRITLTSKTAPRVEEIDIAYNGESLVDTVQKIRQTLNPATATQTPFDVDRAAHLGSRLFGKLDKLQGTVTRVYVVADGPLQSLPLHVLLFTAPTREQAQNYASLDWLDRSFSLVILPSLTTLASAKQAGPARKPHQDVRYLGIGGPTLVGTAATGCSAVMQSSLLDETGHIDPAKLRQYCQIARAVDILWGTAARLGVDQKSTTLLRDEAREGTVKAMGREGKFKGLDLLVFATHGLLASETIAAASIREPALVLTPPPASTSEDDGLLTLQEVMNLDLDVQWVVLTACNTASGDGRPGSEPLSGLARAFAFAGTRGMVVSHWSVDGDAAVDLTKRFLEIWKAEGLPMDKALAKAMVEMRTRVYDNGQPFNHPAFWAPFVVVGGRYE